MLGFGAMTPSKRPLQCEPPAIRKSMAQASLEQGGRVPLRYGGFWRRVVAALIDGILIGLVLYAIDMFLPIVENASVGSISPPDSAMGIAAEANLTPLGTLLLIIGSWLYAAL